MKYNLQVSNAGYHAFLAAHSNMDKIKLACDNTEQHIHLITECILEGDNSDINTFVPVSLESMLTTANECAEWSREIVAKFHTALKLLEEVHCSCHASQMTNEEKIKELERRKYELETEKEESERSKEDKQKRIETIEKEIDEERKQYQEDFKKTQYEIRDSKQEIIKEEDELEKLKLKQQKAFQEVEKARAARGFIKRLFNYNTYEVVNAEKTKQEEIEKVKEKEQEVETTRKVVTNKIETKEKIIEEKEKSVKSRESEKYNERSSSLNAMEELANRISAALIKLNTNNFEKLDLEDIKKLLKEGIKRVAELEEQWKKLVVFFERVANIVEVAMKKAIVDFSKATDSAIQHASLSVFKKKTLMKLAFTAYSKCNGVSSVASSYLKISNDFLMPSIIELGTLLALDSEHDGEEIKEKTKSIQLRCQNTVDYIGQVVKLAKLENANQVRSKAIEMK